MVSIKLWDNIKLFAARHMKIPGFTLHPNMLFNWFQGSRSPQSKQVLPKNPEIYQLRNLAKNAIVRIPIEHIEDTISRLDFNIENVDPTDTRKYTKQRRQLRKILSQPNVVQGWVPFIKMQLEDLLVYGASAFQKSVGGPNGLYLYPTDASTLQFCVPYDYANQDAARYMQMQPSGMVFFSANEVAYLQKNYFSDRPESLSPLRAAYDYIVYLLNSGKRADAVAANATSDFLVYLEGLTPDQLDQFRTYMAEEIEGTGKIPIITGNGGLESKQIKAINKDSLMTEYQEFLRIIVGLAFKYPPQRMGIIKSGDRSTEIDLDNYILENCIKPWGHVIEDAINEHIVKTLGLDTILKVTLSYAETEAQKAARSTRVCNEFVAGIISENEARVELGYEQSDSKYAKLSGDERKATINLDMPSNKGGFNGLGNIKDNYGDKVTNNKLGGNQ